MATNLFLSSSSTDLISHTTEVLHKSINVAHRTNCFASFKSHISVSLVTKSHVSISPVVKSHGSFSPSLRKSVDNSYKPSIWDYDYVQSLDSTFKVDKYQRRAEKLKEDVKMIFENFAETGDRLDHLELIDDLQRLGLAYHFEDEIKELLEYLYISRNNKELNNDLYVIALEFRLFCQHGYHISQGLYIIKLTVFHHNTFDADDFKRFIDDKGCLKEMLYKDVRGILSLYEASYLSFEGEKLIKEALNFTNEAHQDLSKTVETNLSREVQETFDLPLHWRSPRWEVRRFIDIYEKRGSMNPLLLELAKLDFNLLQGLHQEELQNESRWWNKIDLSKKLGFARDRLVESFLWSALVNFEPQFKLRRTLLTRAISLITVIDDIYDVYDAVERWDINTISQLPNYMKRCFIALYNFVNEIVYDILKEQDFDILPYLKKVWFDLVKSYMVEARWYHSGNKPTFVEYIKNGSISTGVPLAVTHAYVASREPFNVEALEFLANDPDILNLASFIFRLSNDCVISKDDLKTSDATKSIECYMSEAGVTEEVARKHMTDLMKTAWEKMNKCRVAVDSPLSKEFIETMFNFVRSSYFFYHNGDCYNVQDGQSIDRVSSLLFQPIPL